MKYPVPFGRHLLLERINVGGMAEVFKAKSFGVEGFERIVAVKRILPAMAEDAEFITMFVDEARIASHLTHQNIVQIHELGKCEGQYYISMEYVAGRDLRQILDHHKRIRKPMEVAKACYIASRVCEALDYAHKRKDPAGRDLKIIHRDVSPQNVIISFDGGEVKLCDFGIAKAATRASRTQVGVLKGKFAYMSPEQVRGQLTDRRSDLFALGVILYEMLTGERLFLGESDYSTLEAVRNARVPAPTQFNVRIPAELEQIMMKLLARDPKDRYQWASEVHEDLLDHLVLDGKIYHGRHLRQWMQEIYARDIEIENAKLEEFMKLKLPPGAGAPEEAPKETSPRPSPIVVAMAEGAGLGSPILDPSGGMLTYVAPPQGGASDDRRPERTDSDPAPGHSSVEEVVTHTTDESLRQKVIEEIQKDWPSPSSLRPGYLPASDPPSKSPVSDRFGAPLLDGERHLEPDEPIVRPLLARPRPQESGPSLGLQEEPPPDPMSTSGVVARDATLISSSPPVEDVEPTQYDVRPSSFVASKMGGPPRGALKRAHAPVETNPSEEAILKRIPANDTLDDGETLDAAEDSEVQAAPVVFDPSEASVTSESEIPRLPLDTSPGALAHLLAGAAGTPEDKTSIAPRPLANRASEGDRAETAVASTVETSSPAELRASPRQELDDRLDTPSLLEPSLGRGGGALPPHRAGEEVRVRGLSPEKPGVPSSNRRGRPLRSNGTNGPDPGLGRPRRIWEIRPDDPAAPGAQDVPAQHARTQPPVLSPGLQPPLALFSSPPHEGARPMPAEDAAPLFRPRSTLLPAILLKDPRVMMLLAAAVGMLAVALLITLLVTRGPNGASLHIVTEPTQEVEVRLDGKLIAEETPAEARSLGIGQHTIELRASGYYAYSQVVEISEAKPHTMVVPLEPVDPTRRDPEAPRPEDPRLEERADDSAAAPSRTLEPKETPKRPIDADTTPKSKSAVAGEPPSAPPAAAAIKPEPKARSSKGDEGFLMVSTKPSGVAVIIDGKATDLKTPVRRPHPLSAGKHVITFELTDGQQYSFEVTIAAGETKKLFKPLR